jgi:iron(III) transport system substrate-binding protein
VNSSVRPATGVKVAFSLAAALMLAPALSTSSQAQQQPPQDSDGAWNYLKTLKPAERLEAIKRESAREGELTIYGAIAIERAQILLDLFKKDYPGVKAEFVRLTTTDLPQRIMVEARAGRANADAAIVTSDRLEIMSPAIGPYQPTSWDDFDPRFRHGGGSAGWAAIDYELLVEAIAWRTDRVKPEEAPKSLEDLTQPKWKGRTGTVTSLEHVVDSYNEIYGATAGMEKIKSLSAIDNRLYPSIAGLSEAVGSGQIDVAWGVSAMRANRLKKSGAPIDYVYQNPAFGNPDSVMVIKGAKHPYAAAAFTEFLTKPATLEELDRQEPGMAFGNMKGKYERPLSSFSNLAIYKPISPEKYREYNRTVEQLFVRRK